MTYVQSTILGSLTTRSAYCITRDQIMKLIIPALNFKFYCVLCMHVRPSIKYNLSILIDEQLSQASRLSRSQSDSPLLAFGDSQGIRNGIM